MDIRGVISDGKFSESMATKDICILVANDDLTCRNIVMEMLQRCTYEVLYVGKAGDTLNAVWERKEKLGLILANVHRLNVEDFNILQDIQKQFNLPTILMSPDDTKFLVEGQGSSFTAYVVKFLNENDVKKLWQSALMIEKAKRLGAKQEEGTQKAPITAEASTRNTPSNDEATQVHYKPKTREAKEKNEDKEDGHMEKKPRVVWTPDLHEKFLRAIGILGYEKAIPKKILEVMNVPGLTRENVASHLQKYRMGLKRTQECSLDSTFGMNLPSDTKRLGFSSGRSPFYFNSSQGYSHSIRQLYGTQFQPGSFQINPPPAPLYSLDIDATVSTYRSNSRRGQEVSSQGRMHQLCTPNASFSTAMSQKNNHMDVGNLQCIDQNGLMQYQSRYAPKTTLHRNFRVYNDQKKNVLLSITSSSSIDATLPTSSDSETNFLGFRLTTDGKSIEFGQTGGLSNSQIKSSEILVPNCVPLQPTPPATMVGNESSNQCPPISTSCLLEQQPSLPSLENYCENNLVQLSSLPASCEFQQESPLTPSWIPENQYVDQPVNNIPQQQQLLPLYRPPGDGSSAKSSTTAANFVSQHQPSAPALCTSGNMDCFQYPSPPLSCNSQQLHSMLTFGTSEDETTAQCSSMVSKSYQEIFVPPSATPVIDNTVQDHSSYIKCVSGQESPPPPFPLELHEINSFGANADLDVLLNATGSPSNIPELFWDDEIDDILYKINGD